MALPIISADERLRGTHCAKIVLVGVPGSGKTSQIRTLPEDSTLFVDMEAGDLAVHDWRGVTIHPRSSGWYIGPVLSNDCMAFILLVRCYA